MQRAWKTYPIETQLNALKPQLTPLKYPLNLLQVYNLNYTVYVRGWAVMEMMLVPCEGPPALHLGAYDPSLPSSPFLIYVSSSETFPGACVPVDGNTTAITEFEAGNYDVVGKARGATMLFQLRDKWGNPKEEAEDLYLSSVDYYPLVQFQYNLNPNEVGLTSASVANIVTRTYDGLNLMPINEKPISEIFVNDRIVINPSLQYQSEGMFRLTWTTTIAGSYDISIMVLPILEDGSDFLSSQYAGACGWPCTADTIGTATIEDAVNGVPYQNPYACSVQPSTVDVRMFELFHWVEEPDGDGVTQIFWTSLNGVTHDFHLTDGAPVSPIVEEDEEFYVYGRAGTVSWFGIQTRDRFGNVMDGSDLQLSVAFIDSSETYFNWTLIGQGNTSEWNRTVPGGDVTDMGDGYYLVEYRVDYTGSYDIAITLDNQHYLRKLVNRDESTIGTLGYPVWSYGDMFQVEIGPAPLSAQFSTATGEGLLGGVTGESRGIVILGRDAFGNIKWDTDDSADFKLKITKCTGGASVLTLP